MQCKLCGDYYVFTGKNGLCVCCESKLKRMGFYEQKEIAGIKARAEAAEAREKNLQEAIQMVTARAEKAEKKLAAAVGMIYALIADCPPETCREICANHDGVCAKHAEAGHYDHCKGFKWIGEKEE